MSTPSDRLNAIQNIYLDAMTNEPGDLAMAQSSAEVAAVQANAANARSTYYSAEAAELTANSAAVETAITAASGCLEKVKAARANAADIPTLLAALNSATTAATTLLKLSASTT